MAAWINNPILIGKGGSLTFASIVAFSLQNCIVSTMIRSVYYLTECSDLSRLMKNYRLKLVTPREKRRSSLLTDDFCSSNEKLPGYCWRSWNKDFWVILVVFEIIILPSVTDASDALKSARPFSPSSVRTTNLRLFCSRNPETLYKISVFSLVT